MYHNPSEMEPLMPSGVPDLEDLARGGRMGYRPQLNVFPECSTQNVVCPLFLISFYFFISYFSYYFSYSVDSLYYGDLGRKKYRNDDTYNLAPTSASTRRRARQRLVVVRKAVGGHGTG